MNNVQKQSAEPAQGNEKMLAKTAPLASAMKSNGGWRRIVQAGCYSVLGLKAAWEHEAAFRQEVAIGAAMLTVIPWLAPSLLYGVLMFASILLVWCVEMVNSAIEALADAVSTERRALLGRAKDMGSAAVMFSLLIVLVVWGAALYARLSS